MCSASGSVNLAFAPAKNLPVTDDTSIVFLSGSTRSLQFSVSAGASAGAHQWPIRRPFQTGTTAGTITFSVSRALNVPSDLRSRSSGAIFDRNRDRLESDAGQLDLAVVGYDNTYSAGTMTFTFLDATGNMIGSPIDGQLHFELSAYFAMYKSGSYFLMRISFPVKATRCRCRQWPATLTNTAGQTQTGMLTFQ